MNRLCTPTCTRSTIQCRTSSKNCSLFVQTVSTDAFFVLSELFLQNYCTNKIVGKNFRFLESYEYYENTLNTSTRIWENTVVHSTKLKFTRLWSNFPFGHKLMLPMCPRQNLFSSFIYHQGKGAKSYPRVFFLGAIVAKFCFCLSEYSQSLL